MSVIANIDGTPLFSTKREAKSWANKNGFTGFHKHDYQDIIGYMGGIDHAASSKTRRITNLSIENKLRYSAFRGQLLLNQQESVEQVTLEEQPIEEQVMLEPSIPNPEVDSVETGY